MATTNMPTPINPSHIEHYLAACTVAKLEPIKRSPCEQRRLIAAVAALSIPDAARYLLNEHAKNVATPIDRRQCKALRGALQRLRAFSQEWEDLSYPVGDPRRVMPDRELPQDWITQRDTLRAQVTREAALLAGESAINAAMWADFPLDPNNPYNVERAQYAEKLGIAFAGRRIF